MQRIFVAGHTGLAGSAVCRALMVNGTGELLLQTHTQLELPDARAVDRFFARERPDRVVMCAAKVGGIQANIDEPADFISENLMMQQAVLGAALKHDVSRLLFLGSSCIYPRDCPQPIRENYLLTGPLEWTNRSYAVAKIAGVETCWAFNRQHGTQYLAVMPTNLYGPGDHYDLRVSHVLPAMLRRFHEAKVADSPAVVLWGSGRALREFMHADDLGAAVAKLLDLADDEFDALLGTSNGPPLLNIGSGEEVSIATLALMVARCVGYEGRIEWDSSRPDGTPRKLLDSHRMRTAGWVPLVALEQGLARTYRDFVRESAAG